MLLLEQHQEGGVAVVDHVENLYNSLSHYIGVLEQTGSYSKSDSAALLIYTFIVDAILEGPMQSYVSDEDLALLNRVFDCLSRHRCLISRIFPGTRISRPRQYYNPSIIRETQDYFPRLDEDSDYRRAENNI